MRAAGTARALLRNENPSLTEPGGLGTLRPEPNMSSDSELTADVLLIGHDALRKLLADAIKAARDHDNVQGLEHVGAPVGGGWFLREDGLWRLSYGPQWEYARSRPGLFTREEVDALQTGPAIDPAAPIIALPIEAARLARALVHARLADRIAPDVGYALLWPHRDAVVRDLDGAAIAAIKAHLLDAEWLTEDEAAQLSDAERVAEDEAAQPSDAQPGAHRLTTGERAAHVLLLALVEKHLSFNYVPGEYGRTSEGSKKIADQVKKRFADALGPKERTVRTLLRVAAQVRAGEWRPEAETRLDRKRRRNIGRALAAALTRFLVSEDHWSAHGYAQAIPSHVPGLALTVAEIDEALLIAKEPGEELGD